MIKTTSQFRKSLFRRPNEKYVSEVLQNDSSKSLKRTLSWWHIAVMGVSMSVGAGIFSIGAKVIVEHAGPAAIISFFIAAFVCFLAAMCYAEFTSKMPITGSAYTFSLFTFGECVGWFIGWNIILELLMAISIVIKFWSIYVYNALRLVGIAIPPALDFGAFKLDWVVFLGAILVTILLIFGTKLSTSVSAFFVVIKIAVILIVIIAGIKFFNFANLFPFIPQAQNDISPTGVLQHSLISFITGQTPHNFGVLGILSGAALIFFAFVGFDNAAAAAEETINPKKNMPLGLLVGIGLVSFLYIAVAIVTAGMVSLSDFQNYLANHLDVEPSISTAFEILGQNQIGAIVSVGALLGLTTVILVAFYALSRVIFAISRDGLFPSAIAKTSRFGTPHRIQIILCVLVIFLTTFTNIETLAEMINIGTLTAFAFVAFAIPIMRKNSNSSSKTSGTFEVPLSPFLPVFTGVCCIWCILNLDVETWLFFIIWLIIGFIIYFIYGRRNSIFGKRSEYVL